MQKKISVVLLTLFLGMFFFYSCSYDTLVPAQISPNQQISFSSDIQPIFTQNCIRCHNGTTNPDLRSGKSYSSLISGSYIDTVTPNQSLLYTVMAPNGAMYSYSSPSDAQLVLLWIKQGAKNN